MAEEQDASNEAPEGFSLLKRSADLRPEVTQENETNPDWRAVIIEMYVKFIFQKWTNAPNDDITERTTIGTGGSHTIRSRIDSCCAGGFLVLKVRDRTGKVHEVPHTFKVDGGEYSCGLDWTFTLGSSNVVTLDQLATGNELFYKITEKRR